ncbi:MAG: hypothetical protein WAW06_00100 [bacterium]
MSKRLVRCMMLAVLVALPRLGLAGVGSTHIDAGWAFRADRSTGVVSSWENESAIFVGLHREVRPGLDITSRISFRRGRFAEYRGDGGFDPHTPETMYGSYHGGSLDGLEATVGARVERGESVVLSQSISGGVLVAGLARLTRATWDMNHPEHVYTESARDTDKIAVRPLVGIGTALTIPCSSLVGVGVVGELWLSPDLPWSDYLFWPQLAAFVRVGLP